VQDVHVAVSLLSQLCGGFFRQLSYPLNGIDVFRYFGENGRGVA
jgi:hypothetical protein